MKPQQTETGAAFQPTAIGELSRLAESVVEAVDEVIEIAARIEAAVTAIGEKRDIAIEAIVTQQNSSTNVLNEERNKTLKDINTAKDSALSLINSATANFQLVRVAEHNKK